MNMQAQLFGMLILVLLYVFYKSHRTLQLYTEKIFSRVMKIAVISLSLDILSLVVIHYRYQLPMLIVLAVCKLYVITLIWEAMSALSYVLTELYTEKMHRQRTRQLSAITLIESLVICALPIYIFDDGIQVYTYGPATLGVYSFAVLYILGTLSILGVFRKKMNKRRVFSVALWMFIWIGAALIQFFHNEYLIVGFASAIGVLILFVIMENPEANLDRKLSCFNSYALSEYFKQLISRKTEFSVLEISFGNSEALENYGLFSDEVIRRVLQMVSRQTGILAFKNVNSSLIFIGNDTEQLYRSGIEMLEILSEYDTLHKEVRAVLVQNGDAFLTMDEVISFLTFIHTEYADQKDHVFLADESIIAEYRKQYVIEQEIAAALLEDRVEVFFQPIYSNKEKKFTSAEALVRIREKNGELLAPGVFIPIAEDSGQILELGERVFEKVCDFLKNTDAVKLGIHYIEINLSIIQCEQRNLASRLISIINRYNVDPGLINLEITETASISARNVLLENMRKLIEYGFTFSLDDFGKGESNLMYVVEMPVSFVKLDYDMSKAFFNSVKAKHVVRAVVGMAHDMNLKLVAEGIETEEETDSMNQEGIDYIQGYYYAKPLPRDMFLEFLRNENGNE